MSVFKAQSFLAYKQAELIAVKSYRQDLDKHLETNGHISQEEIKKAHEKYSQMAIQEFEKKLAFATDEFKKECIEKLRILFKVCLM